MSVLVCGGAGYVGSHTVRELIKEKEDVLVIDNLQTGHVESVSRHATFYQGDIRDKNFLGKIFMKHKIESVLHFAASSLVAESMNRPLDYFNNNVYGLQILLECMLAANVDKLVFSSTCAVYGTPEQLPISEANTTNPENCYGETKLVMEKMMQWVALAHNIRYVSLRYFNAAGASDDASIGEDHSPETHLIPLILQIPLGKRSFLNVFGDDYDTFDGTCIRDYVHVTDLADAHVKALGYLRNGNTSNIFNLGSGKGYSVKEIIHIAEKITKVNIPLVIDKRRAGDAAKLVATIDKAKELLKWQPLYSMEDIMKTAWYWHKANPDGFYLVE